MDTMVVRKTMVFLVGYLLIGWVVWIFVNLLRRLFRLDALVTSTGKHIVPRIYRQFWDELNNTDFHFLKKFSTVPRALLLLLVPGVVVLLFHLLLLLDLVLLLVVVVHQHHLGLHWLWFGLF